LTTIGLSALLSYDVGMRRREIALRIAIGASRYRVAELIVRQGIGGIGIGMSLGIIGAFAARLLLSSMLYNVPDISFSILASTAILLGMVAVFISVITAVRAASIEPMTVLRHE